LKNFRSSFTMHPKSSMCTEGLSLMIAKSSLHKV
jgi:hypothetical protein